MSDIKIQLTANYKDFNHFLNEQGPAQLMVNYDDVLIIANVFSKTAISLNIITGVFANTKFAGLQYIEYWVTFLNDFLNIRNALSKAVIKTLSYSIYRRYNYFTLADLKLLFDFILDSKYGTFYGSVDTQRILTSFSEYAKERKDFEDKLIQKEKDRLKELENNKKIAAYDPTKYRNVELFFSGKKILK